MSNRTVSFRISVAISLTLLVTSSFAFPIKSIYPVSELSTFLSVIGSQPSVERHEANPDGPQIEASITTLGSPYIQNFDTLSSVFQSTNNTLAIPGWALSETGTSARVNQQYAVDTGLSSTGDTYSYGADGTHPDTDRALGMLRSGTIISIIGSSFSNNTGSAIESLDVSYVGEQWRLGATGGRTDQLNFEYSTDATSLTTGSWTTVTALNFVTPNTTGTATLKDGNDPVNRTSLASTISGLNIPNGATFWVRWTDVDASGADDGLAIDDFSLTANGTPAAPEMNVVGNSVSITDGDATPDLADHTNFGSTATDGGTVVRTFTIENIGTAPLDLTGTPKVAITGNDASDFTVTLDPASPVSGPGTTTFQVTFDPSASGSRSATLSIANDDTDENPYNFDIQGAGTEPIINVTDVAFGIVNVGTTGNSNITVSNSGDADLVISSATLTDPSGWFGLTAPGPGTTVGPSGSITVAVSCTPPAGAVGSQTANVIFASNSSAGADNSSTLTCTAGAPEINVTGNGITIGDGDTTPDLTDHTDFGSAAVSGGSVVRTFTIHNTGNATLTVSIPSSNNSTFAITASGYPHIISPGGSRTFNVTFDPSTPGLHTATISVTSTDADENPYDFAIQGTGLPPATLVVDKLTDDVNLDECTAAPNDCSLRGAISIANDGDTITFDPGLFLPEAPQTIFLNGSELSINASLIINGPGANLLTISASNASRVFYIAPGNTVTLDGLTIADGLVSGSFPTGSGSGIFNDESTLTVSRSIVRDNTASGFGAGIFNDSGALTVTYSTIRNNTSSSESGGGLANRTTSGGASTLNVSNSTLSGNSAIEGGGIFNDGSSFTATLNITNSTVSGNTAVNGAGISNSAFFGTSALNITNSTISSNSSTGNGGGISNSQFSPGIAAVVLNSSIVSDNSALSGPDIANDAGTLVGSYNLVETTTGYTFSSGSNNIFGVDPQLGPLADNGGPTFTHKPAIGFPGHDKGCAFGATTDQRGMSRTVNWPIADAPCSEPGENGTDIGAFEILIPTAANASINGRVLGPTDRGIANVMVTVTDMNGNRVGSATTNPFGFYTISDLPVGYSYVVTLISRRFLFDPSSQVVTLDDDLGGLNFRANP